MREPSAEVVLEGTATFLHGIGACVGSAGLVYHGIKRQWAYFGIALLITVFHGVSAYHHDKERRKHETVSHAHDASVPRLLLVRGSP